MRKPFKEIFKKLHEKLDREGEESNEEEDESTTSSEKSEQDSENDTSTEDEEESNITQTLQVHHVMNEKHMMKKIQQKLKMIHQKREMWLKCKHMKTMGSKTMNKITNS